MPSRSGFLVSRALAISSARAGSASPASATISMSGIVLLDRRLEGVVALVGHVVLRVVEDPGDLALAADRGGERVGGLLAHLVEIVGDDADIVLALHVAGRDVRQEDDLHAGLDRRLEGLRRGGRVERQGEDDARVLGEHGLDVAHLLGGIEAGIGGGDDLDAESVELVGRAGGDRVHEVRRGVPEQRGRRVHVLDLRRPRRRVSVTSLDGVGLSPPGPIVWASAGVGGEPRQERQAPSVPFQPAVSCSSLPSSALRQDVPSCATPQ